MIEEFMWISVKVYPDSVKYGEMKQMQSVKRNMVDQLLTQAAIITDMVLQEVLTEVANHQNVDTVSDTKVVKEEVEMKDIEVEDLVMVVEETKDIEMTGTKTIGIETIDTDPRDIEVKKKEIVITPALIDTVVTAEIVIS